LNLLRRIKLIELVCLVIVIIVVHIIRHACINTIHVHIPITLLKVVEIIEIEFIVQGLLLFFWDGIKEVIMIANVDTICVVVDFGLTNPFRNLVRILPW